MTNQDALTKLLSEVKEAAKHACETPYSTKSFHDSILNKTNEDFGTLICSEFTEKFILTAANNAVKLCKIIDCLMEGFYDFKLGHLHAPDLSHTRAMGDTYGWCDYCQTKVNWGLGLAEQALEKANEIASEK